MKNKKRKFQIKFSRFIFNGWLTGLIVYSILGDFRRISCNLWPLVWHQCEFHVLQFTFNEKNFSIARLALRQQLRKKKKWKKKRVYKNSIKFIVYGLCERITYGVGRECCCLAKLRINVFSVEANAIILLIYETDKRHSIH